MVRSIAALLVIGVFVAACSSPVPSSTSQPQSEPAASEAAATAEFDVALVQSTFRDECVAPTVVDDEFCLQVDIDGMTADGTTLIVPTGVDPDAVQRAGDICRMVAGYDGATGGDLGYERVKVLNMEGGATAECVFTTVE